MFNNKKADFSFLRQFEITNTFGPIIYFQIDQKVDVDWPLLLVDHNGHKKSINLKPGQMVLYESATVPHGRQFPFKGDHYDNVFVHYAPSEENYLSVKA